MSDLDAKINEHFAGFVVRKDLVKAVKGNAIVPTYVLEYLLGQYCATDDEASIQTGIETVKEILRKHYVHRSEAGLIQSTIKEKGRYKVIDQVSVSLNEKTDSYEAVFDNLGIKKVAVDSGTVKAHPKLLVTGVWCIADVQYEFSEDARTSPWILESIKPIQIAKVDYDHYREVRSAFTTDEWIDLLMQSIGFRPEAFGRRSKLLQLLRLIPFVERNYNLIELGPKGTGKSHIYSEFSPHGQLISGGEVSIPKLFVNNSNGRIGLVGYWDVVAFDEFAGREKTANKALVDIMKNYMANKSFSRGVKPLIVRSGYRSPSHNRAVGGAPASKHMLGTAFDIAMSNHDPATFAEAARAVGFLGFGTYPRSGFMHIDLGPARSWGEPFAPRATPFVPEVAPAREVLADSRTLKGGGAAGIATVGAAGVEFAQDVLAETQSAILPLVPYLDTLRWVFIAVALIGIAVAIHARIDDWKRGQR